MSQKVTNPTNAPLNRRQAEALQLCFLDDMTDMEIAKTLHTSRQTLCRWKALPEFRRQLDELHTAALENVRRESIAVRSNRIAQLIDRARRMRALIQARSEEHADAPGGSTGLLCREVKVLGKGEDAEVIDIYKADTALLREMRETEKQIAIEVGEWSEKAEISGPNGGPIVIKDERKVAAELVEMLMVNKGLSEIEARTRAVEQFEVDPADLPATSER